MGKSRRTAAIDIGTTKVACVVAETDSAKKTTIVGYGTAPPAGFKQGVVVDLDKATESMGSAVSLAEEMAGGKVKTYRTFVGINGDHIKHLSGIGAVPVRKPAKGIGTRDLEDVIKQAQTIRLPNDEQILHVIPTQFIVDGQKGVRKPLELFGVRLEVEALLIIGAVTAIENIHRVLERLDIKNRFLVLQSLACSFAVCSEDDKEMGCALVDLGGVTDFCICREGEIRFTKVLGVGANNITKDVAIGLRTTFSQAEKVKREHGVAMASMVKKDEAVKIDDASGRGTKQVSRRLLASVIEPRMEEILNLVNSEIHNSGMAEGLSAGVILTGGGSMLEGVDVLAEQVLGMPVKIGRPDRLAGPKEVINNPAFATAVGLIHYGIEGRYFYEMPPAGAWERFCEEVKGWFS
ncbi:cell division protein FtsA [candidate division WOR-3 bacterium JGI_Cruoil_03_51_56]|uniref:Cell division protein FtsA n=1 Tax=candidate division WOR-3 bacterium JGI_Cruoil_03_51_56 TaxID=1973747 RepID=A0A235BXB3_UNCW3|nr:MAG: cell division protein FtsA [candidate division WOR-3 bacterium JGI_Cruoil_03_51_56]